MNIIPGGESLSSGVQRTSSLKRPVITGSQKSHLTQGLVKLSLPPYQPTNQLTEKPTSIKTKLNSSLAAPKSYSSSKPSNAAINRTFDANDTENKLNRTIDLGKPSVKKPSRLSGLKLPGTKLKPPMTQTSSMQPPKQKLSLLTGRKNLSASKLSFNKSTSQIAGECKIIQFG